MMMTWPDQDLNLPFCSDPGRARQIAEFVWFDTVCGRDRDPHMQKYCTDNFVASFASTQWLTTQKKLRHEHKIKAQH